MTKPAMFSPHYYLRPRNLPCDGTDSVIGGDIRPFDIENRNFQQPSLERVYCVFVSVQVSQLYKNTLLTY